jgi:hypothetical protein
MSAAIMNFTFVITCLTLCKKVRGESVLSAVSHARNNIPEQPFLEIGCISKVAKISNGISYEISNGVKETAESGCGIRYNSAQHFFGKIKVRLPQNLNVWKLGFQFWASPKIKGAGCRFNSADRLCEGFPNPNWEVAPTSEQRKMVLCTEQNLAKTKYK